MKRLMAIFIITMLVFSSFNTVFAAEKDDPAYERALALRDAGILYGYPDGTFGLDKELKRCESIAILLRALNVYDEAGKTAFRPIFTDVPKDHWAAGYIIYAYDKKITAGISATRFAPERNVTAKEFCALLLRYLLNEPEISPDTVFGYIVTQTPLDIGFVEACFAKDKFLRSDMVHIVYELCLAKPEYGKQIASGQLNVLEVNDIVYFELEGNPSTGYHWEMNISDEKIVSNISIIEKAKDDKPDSAMAGVPVTWIYQFKAIAKGVAAISMTHVAPGNQPENNEITEYKLAVVKPVTPVIELNAEKENKIPVDRLAGIEIDSNATTGYAWVFEDNDYMRLADNRYTGSGTGIPGAGGKQAFIFYASKKGTTEIVLNYLRPFETNATPVQTMKIKVIIE